MKAEVRNHHGTPTLFIDGQPVFAGYMWSSPPSPDRYPVADIARGYAEAGIHMYAFDVGTSGTPPEWGGTKAKQIATGTVRDHFDFSSVEARFQQVIRVDPLAKFHLRVHLEMPDWWHDLYPDECELVSNGVRRNQSYASTIWRDQAKAFLTAYIAHIESIGMADRVIAYQTGAGTTGEWVKETAMSRPCGDYSSPMLAHFRGWLQQRYSDHTSLQHAWDDDQVTFNTAAVPTAKAQLTTQHFSFRDPRQEQQVIDYYRCLAELCAALVIDFNRTVKEATQGNALAGAFFGYLGELAWNSSFFGSGTESETTFHIEDKDAHELGQVVYSLGRCKPGLAIKEFSLAEGQGWWTSIYCAAPNLPAPVLRGIARHAGVHIYNDTGDVLCASRNLLAVHTVAGGERTFKLPSQIPLVVDLFERQALARDVTAFTVKLPPRSTSLYYTGDESVISSFSHR